MLISVHLHNPCAPATHHTLGDVPLSSLHTLHTQPRNGQAGAFTSSAHRPHSPHCTACGVGTLLASLMMVVSLGACRFSFQLLLYSSQLSNRRTYEELAEQALGPAGRHMVEVWRNVPMG